MTAGNDIATKHTLGRYRCPHCGGQKAYTGNPGTGTNFRGSARCTECGESFAAVGRPDLRLGEEEFEIKEPHLSDMRNRRAKRLELEKRLAEREKQADYQFVHYSREPREELRPLTYDELVKDRTSGRWENDPAAAQAYVKDRKKFESALHRRLAARGILHDRDKSFLYGTIEGAEQFGQHGQHKHVAPLDPLVARSFFDVVGDGKSRVQFGSSGLQAALRRWHDAAKANKLKETTHMGMPIRPRIEVITPETVKPQEVKQLRHRVRAVLPVGDRVLLEKLQNSKWPHNLGKTRFPGGGVEEGETHQQALVRELKEELGADIDPATLEYLGADPRPEKSYEHYYRIPQHSIKPGQYQATKGQDSVIHIVAGQPAGDDYLGPDLTKLVKQADLKPDVELQPHQKHIQELAALEPLRMLLVHGLGSGKSLSGIAAAERLGGSYTAVAPASLRPNYEKEIDKFTDRKTPHDVMSYTEVGQGKIPDKVDTVIFDESQKLRNPASQQTQQAIALADRAKQVLMLSGTPIVNHPSELTVPIRMLTGRNMTPAEFTDRYIQKKFKYPTIFHRLFGQHRGAEFVVHHPDELKKILRKHVDYYKPDKPLVPTTQEDIHVDMSPEQHRLYEGMWDRLPWYVRYKLKNEIAMSPDELQKTLAFLTGPRQVGLSTYPYMRHPDPLAAFDKSPKLQKAMEKLKETLKDPRAKALVFANYIDAGLTPYAAALGREGIPHGVFHGGLNDKERKQLVDDYNANKIRVALLGPSGTEGLSFRHTSLSQLLDPHYQTVRSQQAIGRGVRYDSHQDLPPELQNVKIQRFFSRLPKGLKDRLLSRAGFDRTKQQFASDDYLDQLSKQKEQLNSRFMQLLEEVGTEKKSARPVDQLLAAKRESDRKNYRAKHQLIRQLIVADPTAFVIDSENNGILGLTHRSGFKIHVPKTVMPGAVTVSRVTP